MDRLKGVRKKQSDQCVPQMCLLRKITYGEFSEFVQEKKVHILHSFSTLHKSNKKGPEPPSESHRSKGISDLVL